MLRESKHPSQDLYALSVMVTGEHIIEWDMQQFKSLVQYQEAGMAYVLSMLKYQAIPMKKIFSKFPQTLREFHGFLEDMKYNDTMSWNHRKSSYEYLNYLAKIKQGYDLELGKQTNIWGSALRPCQRFQVTEPDVVPLSNHRRFSHA